MLLSRSEMAFDFRGALFDLSDERDRQFVGFVFNQFLYGEITGIQVGHWLYHAPSLSAATFLAKQASEELSHVKRFVRLLSLIGERPEKAHPLVRFLSTGMMGGNWGEHVAIEMALGEGLVLHVFYAMEATLADLEVRKILQSALEEEESHVSFGEKETLKWLEQHPSDRKYLLTLALIQWWALRLFKHTLIQRLQRMHLQSKHPVMLHFDAFFDHVILCYETRIDKLGLFHGRLRNLGAWEAVKLLLSFPIRRIRSRVFHRVRKLTKTYLRDPIVLTDRGESKF